MKSKVESRRRPKSVVLNRIRGTRQASNKAAGSAGRTQTCRKVLICQLRYRDARFGFVFFNSRSQARIKTQRVIPEDFALELIAHILPVDEVRNVVAEVALIALVRVVRCPDQR